MRTLCCAALALGSGPAGAAIQLDASFEMAVIGTDAAAGFPDGTHSKLRYGSDDGAVQLLGGYLQLQSDLQPTLNTKLALNVNPQADTALGIIDAFLQYRPLPFGGVRVRGKLGAFRPPLSFEHGADGWETLYTTNASAINSWVGEELGLFGAEIAIKRDLASTGGRRYWNIGGAVFYGNDPAGALLSWRGWSLNNWQTAWGGTMPLARSPFIDGNPLQSQQIEPFLEMDDRPGFYGFIEVGAARRWRLRYLYYDNHADPMVTEDGQYGWRTYFNSVSVQWRLAESTGLIAQWMDGGSAMGFTRPSGSLPVEIGFDARFLMLTHAYGHHRFSARYDRFAVADRDDYPNDDNQETGQGMTLSYQYQLSERLRLGGEWLSIRSNRPGRRYTETAPRQREELFMLVLRWSY